MLFLTPTYPAAIFSGLKIVARFNELYFYQKRLLELLISNQDITSMFGSAIQVLPSDFGEYLNAFFNAVVVVVCFFILFYN